jgi:hypothetical protein
MTSLKGLYYGPSKPSRTAVNADNTIIVIDAEIVMTGSSHFTKAAQETNAEHMLIVRDNALAAQDTHNRQAPRQHRQPDVGRGVGR